MPPATDTPPAMTPRDRSSVCRSQMPRASAPARYGAAAVNHRSIPKRLRIVPSPRLRTPRGGGGGNCEYGARQNCLRYCHAREGDGVQARAKYAGVEVWSVPVTAQLVRGGFSVKVLLLKVLLGWS